MLTRPGFGRSTSSIPDRQTPFPCDSARRKNAETSSQRLRSLATLGTVACSLVARATRLSSSSSILVKSGRRCSTSVKSATRVSIWRVMSLSSVPSPSMSRLCLAPVVDSSRTSCSRIPASVADEVRAAHATQDARKQVRAATPALLTPALEGTLCHDRFSLNVGNHGFVRVQINFPIFTWPNLGGAAGAALCLLFVPEPNCMARICKGVILDPYECSSGFA
jgi:hypothetical protein